VSVGHQWDIRSTLGLTPRQTDGRRQREWGFCRGPNPVSNHRP
jgi:hypothetical protein